MIGAELRASILQAAVQGKIVPQDKNDEPASELLKRVGKEREKLVKQGKIRKPKGGYSTITRHADGSVWEQVGNNAPVEITDELPFDIPNSWEWCRGKMLIDLISGVDLKPTEYNDMGKGIPYLTGASNFGIDGLIENRWTEYPKRISVVGDLLITCKGTVGNMSYNEFDKAHIARQIMAIRPFGQMRLEYIRVVLSSMVAQIKASAKGVIPGIERNTILEQIIPVPPLAEQERIVAKLEEVEPMVEEYDKVYKQRAELDASIADDMRVSILHSAVQGKLVPQDKNDEPAVELLKRIREERETLVKQGKAKKSKGGYSVITRYPDGSVWEKVGSNTPVEITDELPFDIPDSWEWARLGSIVLNGLQQVPSKPFNYIDIGSIDNKHQRMSHEVNRVEADKAPSRARKIVEIGDVVYATVRPYLHNACVVDCDCDLPMIASTGFAVFRRQQWFDSRYLLSVLISPFFDYYANDRENSKGVAYPAINDNRLYKALVPVPPLAEQERIVAKIDELMLKVEQLDVTVNK